MEELTQAAKKRSELEINGSGGKDGADWDDPKNNIENLINFGPIYRCLHIHSISGERSEFEQYYFTQRRKQCQLILSLSPSQQVCLMSFYGSVDCVIFHCSQIYETTVNSLVV